MGETHRVFFDYKTPISAKMGKGCISSKLGKQGISAFLGIFGEIMLGSSYIAMAGNSYGATNGV